MKRLLLCLLLAATHISATADAGGEARKRWELMNQIRQEKFDLVLPEAM